MTPRKRRALVLLAALATALLTARLGWWQLDRGAQKAALQAALDERRDLPPLTTQTLARDAQALRAQWHRRVLLEGRWQPRSTVFLENRPMSGRTGFLVITPLLLADDMAVLVQRGWAPRDVTDRARVSAPALPEGPVRLLGRIAPVPSVLFEFEPGGLGPIRQNLDIESFARESRLRLLPMSVLQLEESTPMPEGSSAGLSADQATPPGDAPGQGAQPLLRAWPAPAADVHKHYGYAFQWFALCALTVVLYVWFQIVRPRREQAP